MDRRTLTYRVLTAVVGIPLLLGAAWLGGWWWITVIFTISAVGAVEYWKLELSSDIGGGLFLALGVGVLLMQANPWVVLAGTLFLFIFGILPPVVSGNPAREGLLSSKWGSITVGWAYIGVAAGVISSWGILGEFRVILWLFLVIWINDIAAYFAGYLVGRHKLAAQISPGKTWEGAVAGLVAGGAAGFGFGTLLPLSPFQATAAGIAVTIAA
ncbi:MAG: phosphatidate cytidylyltransferase, partial [bacterium]